MKNFGIAFLCFLVIVLSVAVGAVAGHFHGVAVTLQDVTMGQATLMEMNALPVPRKP